MTITPAFYGMLLFNIATFGPTSTFYSVPSSDPAVKIWVSLNPNAGNSYSVLVINKHESSTIAKVSITTPSTSTVAKSITLSNPYGLSGLNKTVLGQVDFNDPTSVYKDIILSIIDSSISISVEPASAMLVRISDVDQGALFSDNSRPVVLPGLGPSATKKVKTCVSRKCSSAYSRPETFLFVSLVIGSCFWF